MPLYATLCPVPSGAPRGATCLFKTFSTGRRARCSTLLRAFPQQRARNSSRSVSRWNAIRHFLTNRLQTCCAAALNVTFSLSRLFVIDSVPHNGHTSSKHFDFKVLPSRCTVMPTPSPLRPSELHRGRAWVSRITCVFRQIWARIRTARNPHMTC